MLGEFQRSLGLELSGPKNDRSALAVLDYYPRTRRMVLVDIKTIEKASHVENSDQILVQNIDSSLEKCRHFTGLSIHGPLSLPPYFQMSSAGKKSLAYKTKDPEVRWMQSTWEELKPRPKVFLPYLQRPLAARLLFLKPHLPKKIFEVFPRATLTRVVSSLGLPKTLARDYSDLEKGLSTREHFFEHFIKKFPQIFIYEKDLDSMILHLNHFNAFLSSLTQHLIFTKQFEPAPRKFPKTGAWIYIPHSHVAWDKVFYGDEKESQV